jgi:hypothetical protein
MGRSAARFLELVRATWNFGARAELASMLSPKELLIEPEMLLRNGRMVSSFADAIALLREHETRPGIDDRDEVLHLMERAQTDEELQAAAEAFLTWTRELDLLAPGNPAAEKSQAARPRAAR